MQRGNNSLMEKFSYYFKELLEKKSIKRASLARELGLKRANYISNVISGLHTPTLDRVEQIAKILKCNGAETSKLLMLAENDRAARKKKISGNIGYVMGTASRVNDMLHPGFSIDIDKVKSNKELLLSLVFKVHGKFLEPLVKNGQKIILSYNAILKIGDWALFEIEVGAGNYRKNIDDFKKMNDMPNYIKSSHDDIIGKLISRKNGILTIGGYKNEISTINIAEKDVLMKARIMGILF